MVSKIGYSEEIKKEVLARVTGSEKESITKVSLDKKINKGTIYKWIKEAEVKAGIKILRLNGDWTTEEKFHMVLESATLSEQDLGEYCRRKGIYRDNIKSWKSQCINANNGSIEDPKKLKTELKEERDKIKKIEKELRFKEKALAETAALLVLRKNVHAIWGDQEED
jgi:transposase-like protein